jgi:prepilin-type N-terminal cleavage/methylation domain-containing protein
MSPHPAQKGFTLIEALLAATLLALALLLGMALVLQEPRIVRRLDAQRRALQTMETTLELLRAGALPLQSQRIAAAGEPELWVTVEPAGYPPGLWDVSLRTLWTVDGELKERHLETMIWRPGP